MARPESESCAKPHPRTGLLRFAAVEFLDLVLPMAVASNAAGLSWSKDMNGCFTNLELGFESIPREAVCMPICGALRQ